MSIVFKKYKKITLVLFAIITVLAVFVIGTQIVKNNQVLDISKLPISTIKGRYTYNVSDPKEAIGISDYVFVGRVEEKNGTDYRYPIEVETVPDGSQTQTVTTPYTNYKLKVLENIKGNLTKNELIEITKGGGVTEDQTAVILHEDDLLPEEGKTYIFIANTEENGALITAGPNSNILIENSAAKSFNSSSELSIYKEAFEKQIPNDRIRSSKKSKFDVGTDN